MTRPKIGCWIELASPEVAEIVAGTGYDFAFIDMEHGQMGMETALRMIMAFAASTTEPFLRVPEPREAWIKRGLDAGAAAVMVPRVDDAATAAQLAGWATYGPAGRRGEGLSTARASRYGRDAAGYRSRWAANGGLICQIESELGLAAAPEIAATPGVTQLFFGPSDFSASLGIAIGDARVLDAAARVAAAAGGAGIEAGSVVFPGADIATLAAIGFTHVADQSDVTLLVQGLDAHLTRARQQAGDEG